MAAFLPSELVGMVGTPALKGHAILASEETDVDDAGRAASVWLVVTDQEIAVTLAGEGVPVSPARCLRSFTWDQVGGCRVQAEVGSGYLQIKREDVWVDLIRFSNRLAPRFREMAKKIEQFRTSREFPIAEERCEANCPRCGGKLAAENGDCSRCAPPVKTLRRVLHLLTPYRGTMIVIGTLSVLAVGIELVPPMLQKILVDNVLTHDGEASRTSVLLWTLASIVGGLAAMRLLAAGIAVWKSKISSEVGTRLTADLRTELVAKLQRLSVSYHDKNQVGMLMSRVAYDTEAMHTFMHQISGGFLLQLLQLLAIGVMLFVLNPKLAFFTLLPTPLVLLTSWFFCRTLYTRHHRYWDAVGRQATALTSLLSGIRVVKSFTQEPREHARFQTTSERLRESRVGVDMATATFSSLIGFLFGLGGLVVWYVGGRDVLSQDMTLGSLMAFLAYLSMFYAPLTTISEGATWISSFLTASHRIFELLDTKVVVDEPTSPQKVSDVRGNILFENVCFSYDDQKPALEDISLEVKPGESIGLVGRSGSGKSTLVCLISRLYDVDSGSLKIDGVDVRQITSKNLRRHVGMVLQEPFLFEGTVAANIAYGDPEAPPEKLIASAKAAAAHDFILRMPFGYETPLGERGAGLSGGERQRVSIARAVLYDPQILILDEATSSVDTESERLIQQAIERFSNGRTTIAIAHRLSTLENADRLIVLDQGRMIEQGTHRELLARDGVYARLTRLQFGSRQRQALFEEGNLELGLEHQLSSTALLEGMEREAQETEPEIATNDWEIRWFNPGEAAVRTGTHGEMIFSFEGHDYRGAQVVRAFPASHSEEFLSIRYTNHQGRETELGMVRSLEGWSSESQELLRRALNRRYLLRIVNSLVTLREDNGFLQCSAVTDDGKVDFVVANSDRSIKRFGANGRLITDVDDNHFLITDIDSLPFLQRRLFRLYFHEV